MQPLQGFVYAMQYTQGSFATRGYGIAATLWLSRGATLRSNLFFLLLEPSEICPAPVEYVSHLRRNFYWELSLCRRKLTLQRFSFARSINRKIRAVHGQNRGGSFAVGLVKPHETGIGQIHRLVDILGAQLAYVVGFALQIKPTHDQFLVDGLHQAHG